MWGSVGSESARSRWSMTPSSATAAARSTAGRHPPVAVGAGVHHPWIPCSRLPAGSLRRSSARTRHHQQQLLRQFRHRDADRAQWPAGGRPDRARSRRATRSSAEPDAAERHRRHGVVTSRGYIRVTRRRLHRSRRGSPSRQPFNLTVNSVWDWTDLTYVLRVRSSWPAITTTSARH